MLPQKALDARAIDKGIHLMHVYIVGLPSTKDVSG